MEQNGNLERQNRGAPRRARQDQEAGTGMNRVRSLPRKRGMAREGRRNSSPSEDREMKPRRSERRPSDFATSAELAGVIPGAVRPGERPEGLSLRRYRLSDGVRGTRIRRDPAAEAPSSRKDRTTSPRSETRREATPATPSPPIDHPRDSEGTVAASQRDRTRGAAKLLVP